MQKTKIEWCDYTWNPVVGCRRGCSYCYAKRLNDRFGMIPDFSVPTFFPERLNDKFPKKPSKIFVGSMTDICFWKREWMDEVLKIIRKQPQHTFMFLTKNGDIYGKYIFPVNCWAGVTYMSDWHLKLSNTNWRIKKYLSIEPLLKEIKVKNIGNTWDLVIIGGLTPRPLHKNKWVDKIIKHCDDCGIEYFLKSNLCYPLQPPTLIKDCSNE